MVIRGTGSSILYTIIIIMQLKFQNGARHDGTPPTTLINCVLPSLRFHIYNRCILRQQKYKLYVDI